MISKEILKKIKRLELKTSRLVEGAVAGGYLSAFKGRGIEFTEVREYFEGDDVRAIDWNVTARMGQAYMKTFMEERDLTVMLAVDLSGSTGFGTTTQTKRELAVDFCAAAALLAVKNNDRVGLLAYTDKVELFVPPRKGKRHVMRLLADLSSFTPAGKGTNHHLAAATLMKTVKHRATLFWVSDFAGAEDSDGSKGMRAAAKRHELVPVVLRDRRELDMPDAGLVRFADPETGEAAYIDTSSSAFRKAFDEHAEKSESTVTALCKSLHAEPVRLWTGSSPIMPLMRYFRRKARHGRH
ncbi:MAG TPA: DUF58 domain-containing protein [Nitrospirota bacterium]